MGLPWGFFQAVLIGLGYPKPFHTTNSPLWRTRQRGRTLPACNTAKLQKMQLFCLNSFSISLFKITSRDYFKPRRLAGLSATMVRMSFSLNPESFTSWMKRASICTGLNPRPALLPSVPRMKCLGQFLSQSLLSFSLRVCGRSLCYRDVALMPHFGHFPIIIQCVACELMTKGVHYHGV